MCIRDSCSNMQLARTTSCKPKLKRSEPAASQRPKEASGLQAKTMHRRTGARWSVRRKLGKERVRAFDLDRQRAPPETGPAALASSRGRRSIDGRGSSRGWGSPCSFIHTNMVITMRLFHVHHSGAPAMLSLLAILQSGQDQGVSSST